MKTLRLQSIFARVTACMVCLALSLTMIPSASAAQTATAPSWIDKSEYVTFSDGAAYQSDMWNTITTLRNYAQSGGEAPAYGKTYYKECVEMSRNVQSGNTQNLKSMVIQRSFPKWSVAERRKTAAASDQAAVCACAHSRYFAGGSPSGLRV